jgi:hypothetical protein
MRGSVVLVAVTLAVAIVLTAALLLASQARSIDAPPLRPAVADAPSPRP